MQDKAAIRDQLQQEILHMQGHKPLYVTTDTDHRLGRIAHSFPNANFPMAALHEFTCESQEEITCSSAFVTCLLSPFLKQGNTAMWVTTKQRIFPPASKTFGVAPNQIIYAYLRNEKEVIWTVEEALQCKAITAVVGELSALDLTQSRRFQLLIEKSGVGCFLIRHRPQTHATSSTSRWRINPLPSKTSEHLPGVSHPRWQVTLLKVRNGRPGSWVVEWSGGRFHYPSTFEVIRGSYISSKTG